MQIFANTEPKIMPLSNHGTRLSLSAQEDAPIGDIPASTPAGGALTRQDLVEAACLRCTNISKREIKRLIDGVIEEMTATLVSGETVKLHDFGSFVVRNKGVRAGRNPRTGAKVPIEPRQVVVFKASPKVRDAMNAAAAEKRSKRGKRPKTKARS